MLYNTDRIRNGGPVMGNDIILKTEKLTKQYGEGENSFLAVKGPPCSTVSARLTVPQAAA